MNERDEPEARQAISRSPQLLPYCYDHSADSLLKSTAPILQNIIGIFRIEDAGFQIRLFCRCYW